MAVKKQNPLETPMMKQWFEFKEQQKDAVLFFRLGDFYEMFFDDAVIASEILGITLTSRHKDAKIPLAGIPYHALDNYSRKLLAAGKKVAICEQIEKPDKKKKTVARKIVRILTPGTVVEESALEEGKSNYLLAGAMYRNSAGLVWVDVSCGDLFYFSTAKQEFSDAVMRIGPKEVILSEAYDFAEGIPVDKEEFEYWVPSTNAAVYIQKWEEKFSNDKALEKAFNTALFYLDKLYFGDFPPLREPIQWIGENTAGLDYSTIANLEIEKTLIGGNRAGSLLNAIDRTVTNIGKRHLNNIIKVPLCNKEEILARHDAVEFLIEEVNLFSNLYEGLKKVKDLERILARILVKRGGPREILALSSSLLETLRIRQMVEKNIDRFYFFKGIVDDISIEGREILGWINSFVEEPPLNYKDGGFINPEYSKEINDLFRIIHNSRELLLELEGREKAATGIANLKVGFNRVFGYYIEVPKRFGDKVPENYIRKQTTANTERYFTPELKELEEKILNAKEIMTEKEMVILGSVVRNIADIESEIQKAAKFIAWIDLFLCFATLAKEQGYERPEMVYDEGISIVDGRHPVVEMVQGRDKYIPASVVIGDRNSRLNIITGPNMGGKSTLMRKVALITLLAQVGSFVPAHSAKIGIVDAIFTRVGASDNLSKGESTFLVEMKETAYILKNASRNSLIILDEIGRGTGTYDGISLARSIAEYIVKKVGALTLFATHYHMLTELSEEFDSVKNFHMAVKEYGGRIQFLYQINEGGSSRSFGVEVARLADMPLEVIKKAEVSLKQLEKVDSQIRFERGDTMQVDIFSMNVAAEPSPTYEEPEYIEKLMEIIQSNSPDAISPREAHSLYYDIVNLIKESTRR